jgi:chitinase
LGTTHRLGLTCLLAATLAAACTRKIADAPVTPTASPPPSAGAFAAPASPAPSALPTVAPTTGPAAAAPARARVVGTYYGYQVYRSPRPYTVADLPVEQLTHLAYGYATITDDGEAAPADLYGDVTKEFPGDSASDPYTTGAIHGNYGQLQRLRQAHAIETLILVGGYVNSTNFPKVAATTEARARFAASLRYQFIDKYHDVFDGIDLDWEYPVAGGPKAGTAADKANYVELVRAVRQELDAHAKTAGRPLRLVVELPGSTDLAANFDVAAMAPYVDWFDVRAFDLHGPGWEARTNFTAPLYAGTGGSVEGAVAPYLAAGVPAAKLVVGASCYGHGWQHVPAANDGLFQQATDPHIPVGTGDTTTSGASGTFTYADLAANYVPRAQRHYSEAQQATWLYDPLRQLFISYEDAASLAAKGSFVRTRGLGGLSLWDPGADDADHTLAKAAAGGLKP